MNRNGQKFNTDEMGFTLIEIVISLGILGIIALGGLSMMKIQNQSASFIEVHNKEIEIIRNLSFKLYEGNICTHNFKGKKNGDTILSFELESGATLYDVGTPLANGTIQIDGLTLKEKSVPVTPGEGIFTLEVAFSRTKKEASGAKSIIKELLIVAQVDAAGAVIKCLNDTEIPVDQSCSSIGGTYNLASKQCILSTPFTLAQDEAVSKFYFDDNLTKIIEARKDAFRAEMLRNYLRKDVPLSCSGGKVLQSIVNGNAICVDAGTTAAPISCSGNSSRLMYQYSSGKSCPYETQTRICSAGSWGPWSGSYSYTSCAKIGGLNQCPFTLLMSSKPCSKPSENKVNGIIKSNCLSRLLGPYPTCESTERVWDTPGELCSLNPSAYKDVVIVHQCKNIF